MTSPLTAHEIEEERLRHLAQYRLMDTPPEAAFDRLVGLAKRFFDAPIVLISLIDKDRQWFKACYGVELVETPRAISFCTHTIQSTEVLVVPDTTQDSRFSSNPFVSGEPYIRFYAGAPLLTPDGYALGTLCILDTHSRELDANQCATLADLAALVVDEMELRKASVELSEESQRRERIAEELAKREAHSRALIENTQDLFTILDAKGHITFKNRAVARILGYKSGELLHRSFFDFVHPEDLPRFREAFQTLLAGTIVPPIEFRFKHCSGSWVTLESLGHNALHEPVIQGIILNSRDLTERKQFEEKLRQSEERFRSAFSLSAVGMAMVSTDGRWLRANQMLCSILGYSEEELTKLSVAEITHPDDLALTHETLQRLISGELNTIELEKRYFHRNGQPIWIQLSVALVRSATGDPLYFISQLQNIHERKEAELALRDSEARKAAILETALDCIITIDHKTEVIEFNPAAEQTFGYTREEARGQKIADLIIPERYHDAHHKGIESFLATGKKVVIGQRQEMPAVRADGSEIIVELAVGHIPVSGPPVFTAYLRDITQRKQDEAALQQAIQAAEIARESAENANHAKSEFISRMSHELRTPLNAILGFGQLLQVSDLSADDRVGVDQILRAGRHLLDLINEILDISRIEAGRLLISEETISIRDICQDSIQLAAPMAAQYGVKIDEGLLQVCSLHVMADRQRLKQVLLNFLSNAMKYNHSGGSVKFFIESTRPGFVRIKLTDTGMGIAAEKMRRLFQPFDRLDAEASGVEGAGIGLALSKKLTEAMNGTIGAESLPGQGSTFWVEFPLANGPAPRHRLKEAPRTDVKKRQSIGTQYVMLYVEDNLSNLQLVQHILARRPEIKLLSATSGLQGIELASEHHPDLILLDLHLPGLSGSDVLQRLQQNPRTKQIPVVMLTADATAHHKQLLLENGAKAYLTKPLVLAEFFETIDLHLPQIKNK
jgi:PAS domain S-box-containing protein